MDCRENLINAFGECGEAAACYKDEHFLMANDLFASVMERSKDEFNGLPVIEIVHPESIDMVQDFMRQRKRGDVSVPTTYKCTLKTPNNPKIVKNLIVLKVKKSEGAVLVIIRN